MIRLVATTVVAIVSNAIGLIVAAIVLDRMTLGGAAFVIAVLIFTGVELLVQPHLRQTAITKAPALLGSTALVATLVSVIVTNLISDGLQISGVTTWIAAAVIIWVIALVTQLLLPFVIFKKTLRGVSAARAAG